jgi:hypothetical protein
MLQAQIRTKSTAAAEHAAAGADGPMSPMVAATPRGKVGPMVSEEIHKETSKKLSEQQHGATHVAACDGACDAAPAYFFREGGHALLLQPKSERRYVTLACRLKPLSESDCRLAHAMG